MDMCAHPQVSQRRWIRFLPFWFWGAAGSEGISAARPLCRSASPALPAPVSGLCVPAANVWGGLLFPDQQLCPFLLPHAQLHQRASSSVDGQHKHCSPVFFQSLWVESCWRKMTFVIHLLCVCVWVCVGHWNWSHICVSVMMRQWAQKAEAQLSFSGIYRCWISLKSSVSG